MVQSKKYEDNDCLCKNYFVNGIDANTLEHFINTCLNRCGNCKGCSIQDVCKDLKKQHSVKKLKDLKA